MTEPLQIEWADPPPRSGARDLELDALLRALKRNKGKWARVLTGLRNGSRAAWFRKRGCDATARRAADGTFDVYARWPEEP